MADTCAIILAAGDGKRMQSKHPKVLCEVLFRPMISWVVDACKKANVEDLCVVLGNGAGKVQAVLPPDCHTVMQQERLGTGHAVMCAREFLQERADKHVLILCGDAPFVSGELIAEALKTHMEQGNGVTVITAELEHPTGYGRILRREDGSLRGIVEERDATPEQRSIKEINSGAYWFEAGALLEALGSFSRDNDQGEYYLTDAVSIMRKNGLRAGVHLSRGKEAVLGANSRKDLAKLNEIARRRVLDDLLESGVDIPFEDGVVIDSRARVGRDTRIMPGTILRGEAVIGEDCVIGPGSVVDSSTVGDSCVIDNTHILQSVLEDGVNIGPYCRVRPGSRLCSGVKIGNFVEIKNAVMGKNSKSAHLTYIGDADVGEDVNFGCGVVVVNYNGFQKHRTVVEDGAFVGCNTNLVAPVRVGKGAYTAAGSTVTKDVPPGGLVIARAPEVVKENRVTELKEKYGKK